MGKWIWIASAYKLDLKNPKASLSKISILEFFLEKTRKNYREQCKSLPYIHWHLKTKETDETNKHDFFAVDNQQKCFFFAEI